MNRLPEFDYVDDLGGGHFGRVYLCRNKLSGEIRAVKHITLPSATTVADWRREAEALAACNNPHVVRIHHASATADGPVLVMDYLSGGNAQTRWIPEGGPVGEVVRCLVDATWGLAHLHNEGLLHRDLKPANLLFDSEGQCVIGDLGLAGDAMSGASLHYSPHVPPELRGGGNWTPAADVYALGVTGWRLLGAPARPEGAELAEALRHGTWPDRETWPAHVHTPLRKALRAAMHPDSTKRPASATKVRALLEIATPHVSWRAAGSNQWIGSDEAARLELAVVARRIGFGVELTRDLGSGARRVKAGCSVADTEAGAVMSAQRVLDALACGGIAALANDHPRRGHS